jgi:hypothetical protein
MQASNHLRNFDTSPFHPSSRRFRRLFFRRLSHFPSSVQRQGLVALARTRSGDCSLAMQLGNALLSGPTLLNGALKLTQASSELVTFALHFGELGRESVAFGGKDGVMGPARGDEDAAAATQHRAASSLASRRRGHRRYF